ncbi:stress response protein nst1 isoform X2 [Cimex lectularius]|uniref:Chitin-binding type-2 domain-containing protein n=1 Tax=Cimex lectularius TaxID=79782 RepID=A0A8I6TDH3_CIMLE|nr:stress response protein nst1 isoform X2 [Cimex lectularius]
MRSVLLALAALLLLNGSESGSSNRRRSPTPTPSSQPIDFDCPEEFGYYAHPTDCTQYYVCVFGGALLESCTGGLMYSHELQTCDWPRNVGCAPGSASQVQQQVQPESRPRQSHRVQQSQRTIPKHDLYTEEEQLGLAEELESDRQQRVYRGQPSTIGQVASDRDALSTHSNAIPIPSGGRDKLSVVSYGTQQQYTRASVTPQQTYVEQQTPVPSRNYSQSRYVPSQYDSPFYNLYDDEVDLYKEIGNGDYQYTNNQNQYRTQYKEKKPQIEIVQQEPLQRGYSKNKYNTQSDIYQSVTPQEYDSYSIQTNDDIPYKQQIQQKPSNRSGVKESESDGTKSVVSTVSPGLAQQESNSKTETVTPKIEMLNSPEGPRTERLVQDSFVIQLKTANTPRPFKLIEDPPVSLQTRGHFIVKEPEPKHEFLTIDITPKPRVNIPRKEETKRPIAIRIPESAIDLNKYQRKEVTAKPQPIRAFESLEWLQGGDEKRVPTIKFPESKPPLRSEEEFRQRRPSSIRFPDQKERNVESQKSQNDRRGSYRFQESVYELEDFTQIPLELEQQGENKSPETRRGSNYDEQKLAKERGEKAEELRRHQLEEAKRENARRQAYEQARIRQIEEAEREAAEELRRKQLKNQQYEAEQEKKAKEEKERQLAELARRKEIEAQRKAKEEARLREIVEKRKKEIEERKRKEEAAKKELEEKRQKEMEEIRRKELEEKQRKEIEEAERIKAEDRRKELEALRRKELEEKRRKEIEEARRKAFEERKRKEIEEAEKARAEARKKELEELRRKELEEKRRKELLEKQRKETEENRRKEIEEAEKLRMETRRRELEQIKLKEEEEAIIKRNEEIRRKLFAEQQAMNEQNRLRSEQVSYDQKRPTPQESPRENQNYYYQTKKASSRIRSQIEAQKQTRVLPNRNSGFRIVVDLDDTITTRRSPYTIDTKPPKKYLSYNNTISNEPSLNEEVTRPSPIIPSSQSSNLESTSLPPRMYTDQLRKTLDTPIPLLKTDPEKTVRVRPTTIDTQSTPGLTRGNSRHRGSHTYTLSPNEAEPLNRGTPASGRPTLKPSTTVVGKASEYVDIYRYPPHRPSNVFPTPQVDKTAAKCRKDVCLLPDCSCGGKDIPGNLSPEETPQIVLLTFDDSVNDLNKGLYSDLFEKGRVNPNGCPISATFYVSHEWTDYSQVQNLYAAGHEMASHSISHSFGEQFSQKKWTKEIAGQREILAAYGGVKLEDVRGMRAPFLAVGGNKMFKMLFDSNFTYDSSMPVYENRPPSWPYTLDYKIFHDCMIPPCPSRSYPGVWEVPMVMWQDLNGGRCSMGDACSNPPNAEGVYKMLIKNFERHFSTNRAPFGLFYHAAWFTHPHHKEGFISFLDTINKMPEVWLVTNWQAIQWIRDPTPISRLNNFAPFQCNYPDRPKKCNNPKVCNLWHKSGVRYMRTCQPCPEVYPWTGKSGVRNSKVDNEIIQE